ncbi:MAG: hypothetical protein Q9187_000851 [Circinaria calcarea]
MAEQNISSSSKLVEPTTKDALFLLHVLLNQQDKLKTDWEAVAQATGHKNASTASTRFYQIKKKLVAQSGLDTASSSTTSVPAAVSAGIKRELSDGDESTIVDGLNGGDEKPVPKVKRERKPRPKVKREKKTPATMDAEIVMPFADESRSLTKEEEMALRLYKGPIYP